MQLMVLASVAGTIGVLVYRGSTEAFGTVVPIDATPGEALVVTDSSGRSPVTSPLDLPLLRAGDSGDRCLTVTYPGGPRVQLRMYGTNRQSTLDVGRFLRVHVDEGTLPSGGDCSGFVPRQVVFDGVLDAFPTDPAAARWSTQLSGSAPQSLTFRVAYELPRGVPARVDGAGATMGLAWTVEQVSP
jgi:hypothetical protein